MQHDVFIEPILSDPVHCEFELPLRRTFYPLGFPLQLETNSPDVIEAASEGWGQFSQAFDETAVRMSLAVSESDTTLVSVRSHVRSREHLMSFFADPENFAVCDFSQNYAFGWVTRAVAADHPLLRYRFLTAPGLSLIGQLALAPLHGALIERAGCGVMLCGESFAGKSTLAYACGRAGWTFIADDGTCLVRKRLDRYAIGDPHTIRFREDAARFFGELADRLPVIRPSGKTGFEVFTRDLPLRTAPGCSVDHIVFLDRQRSGDARIRRYPREQALEYFERFAAYGVSEVRAAQKSCYRRLIEAGIWEMQYADLDDAVACLERLADRAS
ncbi:MAG: hypothetical protein LAP38_24385 [Acidobacteriia bacterium]|nr:hypothetical protein [Terriglobia bacterium]